MPARPSRPPCAHRTLVVEVTPSSSGCTQCLAAGDGWVHLRACLSCGHVGCCDASKNRHATRHYLETAHPLARSLEPGERWVWCFVDEVLSDE